MSNITDISVFTDPLEGPNAGTSVDAPALTDKLQGYANRTRFLKNEVDGILTGSKTFTGQKIFNDDVVLYGPVFVGNNIDITGDLRMVYPNSDITGSNMTMSGDVTVAGEVTGSNFRVNGNLKGTGDLNIPTVNATFSLTTPNVFAVDSFISNNETITNNLGVGNDLTVDGFSTFTSGVRLNNQLYVDNKTVSFSVPAAATSPGNHTITIGTDANVFTIEGTPVGGAYLDGVIVVGGSYINRTIYLTNRINNAGNGTNYLTLMHRGGNLGDASTGFVYNAPHNVGNDGDGNALGYAMKPGSTIQLIYSTFFNCWTIVGGV